MKTVKIILRILLLPAIIFFAGGFYFMAGPFILIFLSLFIIRLIVCFLTCNDKDKIKEEYEGTIMILYCLVWPFVMIYRWIFYPKRFFRSEIDLSELHFTERLKHAPYSLFIPYNHNPNYINKTTHTVRTKIEEFKGHRYEVNEVYSNDGYTETVKRISL